LRRNRTVLSAKAERRIVLSDETIVITAKADKRFWKDRAAIDVRIFVRTTKTKEKLSVLVWHSLSDDVPKKEMKQKLQTSAISALERFMDLLADALEDNPEFKPKLVHYIIFDDPLSLSGPGYVRLALVRTILGVVERLKRWIKADADNIGVSISKVAEALRSGASSVSIAKLATEKVA